MAYAIACGCGGVSCGCGGGNATSTSPFASTALHCVSSTSSCLGFHLQRIAHTLCWLLAAKRGNASARGVPVKCPWDLFLVDIAQPSSTSTNPAYHNCTCRTEIAMGMLRGYTSPSATKNDLRNYCCYMDVKSTMFDGKVGVVDD